MKKFDTTPITDSAQYQVKKGTFNFLQLAFTEALGSIFKWISLTPDAAYNPNAPFVLWGCVNSGGGSAFNISEGAIFYMGEYYRVPAVSFTASGTDVAVCTVTTSQYTTNADPVTLTDSTVVNMHNDRYISIAAGGAGSGTFDFSALVYVGAVIPKKLNLTAGANTTVSGAYPNLQVNAPAPVPSPILVSGTVTKGDVATPAVAQTVSLGVTLADTNYMVFGTIVSKGTVANDAVQFSIRNKTTTSFDVIFHELDNVVQNIDWDWFIIHK